MRESTKITSGSGKEYQIIQQGDILDQTFISSGGFSSSVDEIDFLLVHNNKKREIKLVRKTSEYEFPIDVTHTMKQYKKCIELRLPTFNSMYTDGRNIYTPSMNVGGKVILSCNNKVGGLNLEGTLSFNDDIKGMISEFSKKLMKATTNDFFCDHADIYAFEILNEKKITGIKIIDYDHLKNKESSNVDDPNIVRKKFLVFVSIFFKKYGTQEAFDNALKFCNSLFDWQDAMEYEISHIPNDVNCNKRFGFRNKWEDDI